MKFVHPVNSLSRKAASVWLVCAIGGPLLTLIDIQLIAGIGKFMMITSFGYLLFGLGLESNTVTKPDGEGA